MRQGLATNRGQTCCPSFIRRHDSVLSDAFRPKNILLHGQPGGNPSRILKAGVPPRLRNDNGNVGQGVTDQSVNHTLVLGV